MADYSEIEVSFHHFKCRQCSCSVSRSEVLAHMTQIAKQRADREAVAREHASTPEPVVLCSGISAWVRRLAEKLTVWFGGTTSVTSVADENIVNDRASQIVLHASLGSPREIGEDEPAVPEPERDGLGV